MMESGVRAMEVIVVEEGSQITGALVARVVGTRVGPLAGEGLDKAFGLAIGLRAIGFGEGVFQAQLAAGLCEEFGAVGGAAIGEDALDGDGVVLVKATAWRRAARTLGVRSSGSRVAKPRRE